MRAMVTTTAKAACLVLGLLAADRAAGNAGPFLMEYPNGAPAALGILARLDPTLKPAQETRLRVVKEDLNISFFHRPRHLRQIATALAAVSATYTIENPTNQPVEVDFGFPILRGIFHDRFPGLSPLVDVNVDGHGIPLQIISNSVIYGVIRRHASGAIEKAIKTDNQLARLVRVVRDAGPPGISRQEALRSYLVTKLRWNERDAALMIQYASLDFGQPKSDPPDRSYMDFTYDDKAANDLVRASLGPLSAIGEQKATQFFAQLASRFDPSAPGTYEAVFKAWGGDVRERSVDLRTGQLRPRETDAMADRTAADANHRGSGPSAAELDPTVYARVDYLDPRAPISEAEKTACLAVLKNLPVTFTFAPMNLLRYRVAFPPTSARVVAVNYEQCTYPDSANGGSYQLAYVLHPATLWKEFGPIHLTIQTPKGVTCKASIPIERGDAVGPPAYVPRDMDVAEKVDVYKAELDKPNDNRDELFIGIDRAGWNATSPENLNQAPRQSP